MILFFCDSLCGARQYRLLKNPRLLNLSSVDVSKIASEILTENLTDLVNKGPLAEMVAGLELLRYKTPNLRHELYYWVRLAKNSQAEIDYVEAKVGVLTSAVRCSLENFSRFEYVDRDASDAIRKVAIYPLYAISNLIEP